MQHPPYAEAAGLTAPLTVPSYLRPYSCTYSPFGAPAGLYFTTTAPCSSCSSTDAVHHPFPTPSGSSSGESSNSPSESGDLSAPDQQQQQQPPDQQPQRQQQQHQQHDAASEPSSTCTSSCVVEDGALPAGSSGNDEAGCSVSAGLYNISIPTVPVPTRALFRPIDFDLSGHHSHTGEPEAKRFRPIPTFSNGNGTNTMIASPSSSNTPDSETEISAATASAFGAVVPMKQNLTPTNACLPSSVSCVQVLLLEKNLWESFRRVGNEMIVTKPGRRLFPPFTVSLRGLMPSKNYAVTLRVCSADNFRYKYLNSAWVKVGESEILQNERRQLFNHPHSPNTGESWMKKPVSFKSVKISHNPSSKHGDVLVHTMHKYVMEVIIQPVGEPSSSAVIINCPETAFIAVTSYQNTILTQLKIDNNPFAKGFRDKESAALSLHASHGYMPLQTPLYHRPLWQLVPPIAPLHPTPHSLHPPPLPTCSNGTTAIKSSPGKEELQTSLAHLSMPTAAVNVPTLGHGLWTWPPAPGPRI